MILVKASLVMGKVQRYGFFANNLPRTANPLQNWVVVAGQVFDAADPASQMVSHLVLHLTPLLA